MAQRPEQFTLNMSHPLANGLVFAGLGAMPGSTRYHDSSVFGNHGTLMNMEPSSDWVLSNELGRMCNRLTSSDSEFIEFPPAATAVPVTLACWARARNITANHTLLGLFADDTTRTGRYLSLAGAAAGDYCNAVQLYYGFGVSASTLPFTAESWIHVTGIFYGDTNRICYANGVPGTANTTSLSAGAVTKTWVGKYRDISTYAYCDCDIADPMIWSRALSTSEIALIADPSNVMLSGLINYPRRKWWPVVSGGTPATFKAAWAARRRQVIGGGIT